MVSQPHASLVEDATHIKRDDPYNMRHVVVDDVVAPVRSADVVCVVDPRRIVIAVHTGSSTMFWCAARGERQHSQMREIVFRVRVGELRI